MGYTPVKTVTDGMPWTAKDMNTYVRDNFAAGVPDIFTTKGDIAAATAADVATRLAVGINGYTLIADSAQATGIKWGIFPTLDLVTTKGDLIAATAADALARVPAVQYGKLIANSGSAAGIKFATGKARTTAGLAGIYSNAAPGNATPAEQTETFDSDGIHAIAGQYQEHPRWTIIDTGYYLISIFWLSFQTIDFDVGGAIQWGIYKDPVTPVLQSMIAKVISTSGNTVDAAFSGCDVLYLAAGDVIFVDQTGSIQGPNATWTTISLCKIG